MPKKLRILHVVPYFPPALHYGGIPNSAYLLAREQSKKHYVEVYTSDTGVNNIKKHTSFNGIIIHYFRNLLRKPIFGLLITPGLLLYSFRKLRNFDAIHLHDYRTFQNAIIQWIACRFEIPYIIQPHGTILRTKKSYTSKYIFDKLLGKSLLRNASCIFALNNEEITMCEKLGATRDFIHRVPNGIELADFANVPEKGIFRTKYGIPKHVSIVLFIGRLHKIKGVDILLSAFSESRKVYPNSHCVVVGPDFGFEKVLRTLSKKLGISKHVTFTGPLYGQEKVAALLEANVFVLPSLYETFPLSILEAYACALPVIASNVGAIPDLIEEDVTGWIFQKGDISGLTVALTKSLLEPSKTRENGIRAQEFVQKYYSIEKVTKMIIEIYKTVLIIK